MTVLEFCSVPGVNTTPLSELTIPMCHSGTRLHLLEKMTYWRSHEPQPWRDIFWITGPAGCGKSVIARTLAEMCEIDGQLGAALFLSQASERIDIFRIIPTIVYQLAQRDQLYGQFLVSAFRKDPGILTKPMHVQLRKLLRDPRRTQQYEGQDITLDPLVIILDGFDQCGDAVEQLEFIDAIDNYTNRQLYDPPFVWAIFSRRESHLKQSLARFEGGRLYGIHLKLPISDTRSMRDVNKFLIDGFWGIRERYSAKLHFRTWPTSVQFERIVHASSGYFPFAYCILQYIGDERRQDPVAQLATFLEFLDNPLPSPARLFDPLDNIYRQVLSNVPEEDLSNVLDILRFSVSNLGGSCTLPSIQFALHLCREHIYDALQSLHSVVDVPPFERAASQGLRFYHSSFPEFLRDPSRSGKYTIKQSVQDVHMLDTAEPPAVPSNVSLPEMDIVDGAGAPSSHAFQMTPGNGIGHSRAPEVDLLGSQILLPTVILNSSSLSQTPRLQTQKFR